MRKMIYFHFLGFSEHLCQEGRAVLYSVLFFYERSEVQYGLDSVGLKLIL
jgi:hypothetical protein